MDIDDIKNRLAALKKEKLELLEKLALAESLSMWPEKQLRRLEKRLCLECGEPLEDEDSRGNHLACYHRVYRRIRNGEFTANQAERELGLFAPAKKTGRKPIGGASSVALEEQRKAISERIAEARAATGGKASVTTSDQEAAADAAAAEDEQIVKDPGTPVGGRKKKAAKKPPAKTVETDKKGKTKRRKSG